MWFARQFRVDGYSQRYGITYVDFRDQKRTVKDSGLWYGRAAAANKLDVQRGGKPGDSAIVYKLQ